MRASFWFLPSAIVTLAIGLAGALIALDASADWSIPHRWKLFFGAGAAGSRGLLSAVATSMITVAGVVFSITIVALSLASSQYTSRVLRNFMRDRVNQSVLGVFLGIFAYCLVVLRTIRGGDEGAFVPSFAVMGGLLLAFVGIGMLIYFIHHISIAIQASSIIAAAAHETIEAIDHLFPEELGCGREGAQERRADGETEQLNRLRWTALLATRTGFIESIEGDILFAFACDRDFVIRMERGVGEFVIEGTPLLSLASPTGDSNEDDCKEELLAAFVVGRQRTVQQDVGFGVRQIVDIALKSLSPSTNDTTTAVTCLQYLGAILARLASRNISSANREIQGQLRIIARGPSFESFLDEALIQIRQSARGNATVLRQMLLTLQEVVNATTSPTRRRVLKGHATFVRELARRTVDDSELPHIEQAMASLTKSLSPEAADESTGTDQPGQPTAKQVEM